MSFQGVIPPLITPLKLDGNVDFESLSAVIEFQIASGASGVFLLGSSAEAIYLSDDVRKSIVDHSLRFVNGRIKVLVAALDATPFRVIDQIKKLNTSGIAGWVVTAPFYANLADHEIETHYRMIAKSTELPILAYNIPGNTHRLLPDTLLSQLLNEKVIIGIKDSSNDLPEFEKVLGGIKDRKSVSLLTGADFLAQEALKLGADGFVPGLSNVRPDLFVNILTAHQNGEIEKVADIQERINRLTSIYSIGQSFGIGRHASELGAMKHALVSRGVISTATVSKPLTIFPEPALSELYRVLDSIDV